MCCGPGSRRTPPTALGSEAASSYLSCGRSRQEGGLPVAGVVQLPGAGDTHCDPLPLREGGGSHLLPGYHHPWFAATQLAHRPLAWPANRLWRHLREPRTYGWRHAACLSSQVLAASRVRSCCAPVEGWLMSTSSSGSIGAS